MLLIVWLSIGGIGTREVARKAEVRCAQTAQEMLQSGDWVVPTMGGEPRLEKPPLMYWLIAAVSAPFGMVNEASAMLPVALSAIVTALIVMAWGSQLMGLRGGIFAALILATMPGFFIKGHHIEAEMTLAMFVTLAMWLFSRRWVGTSNSWVEVALATLSLMLAFLTKGPPALVFPVVTFTALWVWSFKRPEMKSRAPLWLVLACTIAVCTIIPWALAVAHHQPEAFGKWWDEIFSERVGDEVAHSKSLFYYVTRLPPLLLPWLLLIPLAVTALKRSTANREWYPVIFWAVASFVVFSLIGGKRWYYLLPMFPAVALLAAKGLEDWIDGGESKMRRVAGGGLCALAVGFAVAGPALATVGAAVLHAFTPLAWLWGIMATAAAIGALYHLRKMERATFTVWLFVAATLFWGAYHATIWQIENMHGSEKPFALWVNQRVPVEENLHVFHTHAIEMVFYLGRPLIHVDDGMDLRNALQTGTPLPLWLIMQRDDLDLVANFDYEIATETIDGRPWDDFEFCLVRVAGISPSADWSVEV